MSRKYIIKNGTAVEVSEEIFEYLTRSDRRIRYVEKDLKRNRYIIDSEHETTKVIPKREESLDRLTEIGKEFPDSESDFQENIILKILLEQALAKLNDKDKYLIVQLFYFRRTEQDLALELKVSRRTINNRKRKILLKLRELIEK